MFYFLRSGRFIRCLLSSPTSKEGRGNTEVLFSSVVDICFAVVARRRAYYNVYCDIFYLFFSPRVDLSALLMLPLSPDSLALRTTTSLIDPQILTYSLAALPCPSLFAGRLHAPSRGIAPFLVPDRCILSW